MSIVLNAVELHHLEEAKNKIGNAISHLRTIDQYRLADEAILTEINTLENTFDRLNDVLDNVGWGDRV